MVDKLYRITAVEAQFLLNNKQITSLELTNSYLEHISDVDGKTNAFLTVTADKAIQSAIASDLRRANGNCIGNLDGIPYALKDNICTKGITTSCASRMLENFIPPYSATVYRRMESSGAVLLGKLNMDEFAMGSSCETSYYKTTRNPFDLSRVPGGSSGGSAAAVAACEAMITLGSDTGGSIRQPAAFCGVVGFKPSYGAVSRYGLIAFASSLEQIGPLARNVADVESTFNVVSGYDAMDATSIHSPLNKSYKRIKNSVIGLPKEYFGDDINEEVKETILLTVKELEKQGAKIKEVVLPKIEHSLSAYYIISSAEASSNLSRYDGTNFGFRENADNINDINILSRSNGFGDEVKRRILLGTFVLSSGYYDAYYKKAKLIQQRFANELDTVLSECDIIITPTVPSTAFRVGEMISDPLKMYNADGCTVIVNLAGLPSISVPCGYSNEGLPIGMQLIGKHGMDYSLLSFAKEYESLVGGFKMAEVAI